MKRKFYRISCDQIGEQTRWRTSDSGYSIRLNVRGEREALKKFDKYVRKYEKDGGAFIVSLFVEEPDEPRLLLILFVGNTNACLQSATR